jgi:exonuclease I
MLNKETLKEHLTKCVAEITFNKVDGSTRTMYCTLMSDYLPEQTSIDENVRHVPRKDNDNTLAVWDMDNKGWRSFRLDSITNVNYIGVNRV